MSQALLRFDVVTIFPEMFDAVAKFGITGRALDRGIASTADTRWSYRCVYA